MNSSQSAPLPLLWGKPRALFGWQGYNGHLPSDWNPGRFTGTRQKGDIRIDDENGVRLELRWETATQTPDVEKSVTFFLDTLEKNAKKAKTGFKRDSAPQISSRSGKRREQSTPFGWRGEADASAPCGYGLAWYCPHCERVTFAHVLGQRGEKPEKIEKLANEVLGELECHGEGGWDSWSVFDFTIEIPTQFELGKAQLLLNKLDLEWVLPKPIGLGGISKRAERVRVQRFPVASVLLDGKTLEEWSDWNIKAKNKALSLGKPRAETVKGHTGLLYEGAPKDPRSRLTVWLFDKIRRQKTPKAQILVWNCTGSNRLFAFESEVSLSHLHVQSDVLSGLACH